jgi:ubiquinone/menaquinone biosynthesis C-methylase UbiE
MGHEPRGRRKGHGLEPIEGRKARSYDRIARSIGRRFYRRVAADLAPSAPEGAAVLDVGTGPGMLLKELADRRPDLRLAGVDLSADMIEVAGRNLSDVRPRPELRVADAADLPLEASSFDIVVSTLSSHYWKGPAAAAAEIARVLRPGGRLLVYDLKYAPFDVLSANPDLDVVAESRFKSGLGLYIRSLRFEAVRTL